MSKELKKIASGYGLTEAKAAEVVSNFDQYEQLIAKWQEKADSIVVQNEDDTESMDKARDLRLQIRKVRIEVEKRRKDLGEEAHKYKKAVDTIGRTIREPLEKLEASLMEKEKFAELQQAKKQAELRSQRMEELKEYQVNFDGVDLGTMDEDSYEIFKFGVVKRHEDKIKAQKEAEEQAKIERLILERKAEIGPYLDYIASDLGGLQQYSEKEWSSIVTRAKAEKQKADAEKEKLQKENEELKQKAEAKKEEEVVAAPSVEPIAGGTDKDKAEQLAISFRNIALPKMRGAKGKKVISDVEGMLDRLATYIESSLNEL